MELFSIRIQRTFQLVSTGFKQTGSPFMYTGLINILSRNWFTSCILPLFKVIIFALSLV